MCLGNLSVINVEKKFCLDCITHAVCTSCEHSWTTKQFCKHTCLKVNITNSDKWYNHRRQLFGWDHIQIDSPESVSFNTGRNYFNDMKNNDILKKKKASNWKQNKYLYILKELREGFHPNTSFQSLVESTVNKVVVLFLIFKDRSQRTHLDVSYFWSKSRQYLVFGIAILF